MHNAKICDTAVTICDTAVTIRDTAATICDTAVTTTACGITAYVKSPFLIHVSEVHLKMIAFTY